MPATYNGVQTYTGVEAALAAGRTYKTLKRHIEDGKLKAVMVGHTYLISRPDLQSYIDQYVNVTVELP